MKWIHVWSSQRLAVIVLDSPFVFHAWLPTHIRARVWRRARSPYQWQQSSVINKLRIFFALICLEAFFQLAPAETCLAVTAPLLPCLIGLEGNRDKYTLGRASGRAGWGVNRWWSRFRITFSTSFTALLRHQGFLWRGVSWEEVKACVRTYGLISGNIRLNRLMSKWEHSAVSWCSAVGMGQCKVFIKVFKTEHDEIVCTIWPFSVLRF